MSELNGWNNYAFQVRNACLISYKNNIWNCWLIWLNDASKKFFRYLYKLKNYYSMKFLATNCAVQSEACYNRLNLRAMIKFVRIKLNPQMLLSIFFKAVLCV